jgi:hypothetical protein
MTIAEVIIDVAVAGIVVAAILYCLYVVVGWARRRQKRAYAIGAALAPFMSMGLVVDPDFRIVHEAKQHKKREEDEPGDPPNDEDVAVAVEPPPESPRPEVNPCARHRYERGTGSCSRSLPVSMRTHNAGTNARVRRRRVSNGVWGFFLRSA